MSHWNRIITRLGLISPKRRDRDMDTIDYELYLKVFRILFKYKNYFTKTTTRLTVGDEVWSYIFKLKPDIEEYKTIYDEIKQLIGNNKNNILISDLSEDNMFIVHIEMDITNNAIYDLYKRNF